MNFIRKHWVALLSIYIAFTFVQSLFFKFTNAPETQHIFGTLDQWAAGLGAPGLFAPGGIFSAYVIGSAELVVSGLLLSGLVLRRPLLQLLGGLGATGVMSGALFFHLATPLGIVVQGDYGWLFTNACIIWVSGLAIANARKHAVLNRMASSTPTT